MHTHTNVLSFLFCFIVLYFVFAEFRSASTQATVPQEPKVDKGMPAARRGDAIKCGAFRNVIRDVTVACPPLYDLPSGRIYCIGSLHLFFWGFEAHSEDAALCLLQRSSDGCWRASGLVWNLRHGSQQALYIWQVKGHQY